MSDRLLLLDPPLYFVALPAIENRAIARDVIVRIRNQVLHGNYEQAARACNVSVENYFAEGAYRRDLDSAHNFMVSMFVQFDRQTGLRTGPTMRAQEITDEKRAAARQRFVSVLSVRGNRAATRQR